MHPVPRVLEPCRDLGPGIAQEDRDVGKGGPRKGDGARDGNGTIRSKGQGARGGDGRLESRKGRGI